ncbi:nucleolar protein 9, partial [Lecanoromycetidae sp. Uapishka_2]
MQSTRSAPRLLREVSKASRRGALTAACPIHGRRIHSSSSSASDFYTRKLVLYSILGLGTGIVFFRNSNHFGFEELHAEAPPAPVDITIEKPRKTKGLSKEENRNVISSQHHQVKRSWENPGVYAWGSNSGRVAAPDSDEMLIKQPRRLPFFDGKLLRDIKMDRNFGAAITENGNLLQWGTGYSREVREPTPTLTGKDLTSITISKDRIIALSSNGKVYSVPVSQEDQAKGPRLEESSWIPFWSSRPKVSYRLIQPKDLGWGEKITSISSGLEHVLLITNNGRLFSAASSSEEFPSRGEMGIPGLSWTTRPPGPYDMPHEVTSMRGFEIAAIATGDHHSLALDKEGRAFAFGDNSAGQLGFDPSSESPYIDAPSLLPISRLYSGTNLSPRVTSVSAGGSNSFFTVDGTRVVQPGESADQRTVGLGRITADIWACGQGILGTLGTGRWTHIQGTPTKIKALSGLFEWDETNNTAVPIRLKRLSIGSTHASATMDNVTHVHAGTSSSTDSRNDTNWGADVLWWGGNEYYQLGMGKRNNVAVPGYIAPLDSVAEKERAKRKEEHRFQITPRHKVNIGGRNVSMEQRVECGRMVSAVYSGI